MPENPPPPPSDFTGLYRATLAPLRRHLARILGNPAEAQDVAHDAYLRVYPTLEKQQAEKPEALLYTTARRLAFNRLRRRRIAPFVSEPPLADLNPSPAPGVVQQVMARQELQQLEQAIAQLPEGCRTVLLLRKIELLSHQEIGERLGIAISTVEKQHARALRLLRTHFQHRADSTERPARAAATEGGIMKPLPSPAAEEAAALWAARLDGSDLSAQDRAELAAWLDADPGHRALLSSFCQFSADLEQQLPLVAGIGDGWAETTTKTKTARLFPRSRWPIWAGVALTAAAAVAVIFWPARSETQFENRATSVAQRSELTLADGTHVELNARTAIAIELKPDERRVRLAGGEAFFHVSRDPQRPFFVETPAGSVRVTGTQFNVRTEEATALEVTVLEGSVQVRPGTDSSPRALAAGERLVREQGAVSVQPLAASELDSALAWRQGQVVFNGTPLREALARFARYHGRALNASDAAAQQRVGGRYSLGDLNGFLAALEEVLPVRVQRSTDGAVRVDVAER